MNMGKGAVEVSICKYDRENGKLTELMNSKKLGEFPQTYTGDQDTPVLTKKIKEISDDSSK